MEMNIANYPTSIIKIACLLVIGICILNGVDSAVSDVANSVAITLSGNPINGDTITLDSNVFEFDTGDGTTAGNIPVTIGASLADTKTNLSAAIDATQDYEVA